MGPTHSESIFGLWPHSKCCVGAVFCNAVLFEQASVACNRLVVVSSRCTMKLN